MLVFPWGKFFEGDFIDSFLPSFMQILRLLIIMEHLWIFRILPAFSAFEKSQRPNYSVSTVSTQFSFKVFQNHSHTTHQFYIDKSFFRFRYEGTRCSKCSVYSEIFWGIFYWNYCIKKYYNIYVNIHFNILVEPKKLPN